MSVVFPVAFDIYMWTLLNEFTIHFMGCKVRLCGLEKLSLQKNTLQACRPRKRKLRIVTKRFQQQGLKTESVKFFIS